jgi:hypothetical protein
VFGVGGRGERLARPYYPLVRTALLTAHYGNPFWVELLLRRTRVAFPQLRGEDVYVIDQDRTPSSARRLRSLLGGVNVLSYPRSEPHFEATGHDHAHVLNLAVREIDAEVLLLFDSDAHPVRRELSAEVERLLEEHDAVLAANAPEGTFSHPSFMVFGPAVDRAALFFDADQLDRYVDTGRKIYEQVRDLGDRTLLLRPTPAFGGLWGTLYLNRSVYHHGSGSFASTGDPGFLRQVATWRREERLFRRKVTRGVYELTPMEARLVRGSHAVRRLRRRGEAALWVRTPWLARRLGLVVHGTHRGLQ